MGKGQLISKGNFGVFNPFKDELEHFNFYSSLGQTFFVRFLEELKKTKSPFKINRPLDNLHISIPFPCISSSNC